MAQSLDNVDNSDQAEPGSPEALTGPSEELLSTYMRSNRMEFLTLLVGDYTGAFSAGLIRTPDVEGKSYSYRLALPDSESLDKYPRSITVHGQIVQVIVEGGFVPPKAPQERSKRGLK